VPRPQNPLSAHYDHKTGRIVVHLSSKLIVSFSPGDVEGLKDARPLQLNEIEISPSGFGIHFPVVDMQEWRARAHSDYTGEIIHAEFYSRFQYYVLGRMATMHSEWKLRRQQPKPHLPEPDFPGAWASTSEERQIDGPVAPGGSRPLVSSNPTSGPQPLQDCAPL
jgi:hypothetical protein